MVVTKFGNFFYITKKDNRGYRGIMISTKKTKYHGSFYIF